MKKVFVFMLLSLFNICFAEKVKIDIIMKDNSTKSVYIDKNVKMFAFTSANFTHEKFVDVKGLEKLEKLTTADFYWPHCEGDWSFLEDFKHLKKLGILEADIDSLKFLENLKDLERLSLEINVDEKNKINFENELINLEKLENLEFIEIHVLYKNYDGNFYTGRLRKIPKFINVKNKPELIICGEDFIKPQESFEVDKKYFLQYSRVDLSDNPTKTPLQTILR